MTDLIKLLTTTALATALTFNSYSQTQKNTVVAYVNVQDKKDETILKVDSIQKEHNFLMKKANSFFDTYKSGIDSRINKTERLTSKGAQDTPGAKSLIKAYQSDSSYYQTVIQKGDSLMQMLQVHDKFMIETMKSEKKLSDKFLFENEEKIDKIKFVTRYAKDIGKQLEKMKKNTQKVLKEMKYDLANQEKKKKIENDRLKNYFFK